MTRTTSRLVALFLITLGGCGGLENDPTAGPGEASASFHSGEELLGRDLHLRWVDLEDPEGEGATFYLEVALAYTEWRIENESLKKSSHEVPLGKTAPYQAQSNQREAVDVGQPLLISAARVNAYGSSDRYSYVIRLKLWKRPADSSSKQLAAYGALGLPDSSSENLLQSPSGSVEIVNTPDLFGPYPPYATIAWD